jgi:Rieske 2Fe-2S family protein
MIAAVSTRKALPKLEPGLPASWYHDPAHYQRELEAFWYGRWITVAREEELPNPGDWRVARLASQQILLLKDQDGKTRAFHNTCRHRGSVLCTVESGSFPRSRIVCPYHAWTYDLEGRLVATPRRMETPDFRMEDFPLHAVACGTWGGFVFVNVDGNAGDLSETVSSLDTRFERYSFDRLKIGKRIVADVKANWKLLCENFSECFHCPPVHPELCRVVSAYRQAGAWGLDEAHTVGPEFAPGAQTLTMDGTSRVSPFENLLDEERHTIYIPEMLPPNLFLNVHPDYVNAHMMFPTGPESVRIVYDWLFEPRSLPLAGDDLAHYVALWDVTNRQDAGNCEWQQQGLHARAFEHGVYVPQEFDVHRFAQWVRAGLDRAQR